MRPLVSTTHMMLMIRFRLQGHQFDRLRLSEIVLQLTPLTQRSVTLIERVSHGESGGTVNPAVVTQDRRLRPPSVKQVNPVHLTVLTFDFYEINSEDVVCLFPRPGIVHRLFGQGRQSQKDPPG